MMDLCCLDLDSVLSTSAGPDLTHSRWWHCSVYVCVCACVRACVCVCSIVCKPHLSADLRPRTNMDMFILCVCVSQSSVCMCVLYVGVKEVISSV